MDSIVTTSEMLWYSNWAFLLGILPCIIVVLFLGFAAAWFFPPIMQGLPFRLLSDNYLKTLGFTAFAHVLRREENLSQACAQTSIAVPVLYVSQRFSKAGELVEQGHDIVSALKKAKLISRREEGILAEMATPQPAFAFQQMATYKVERMLRRYSLLVQFLVVLFTLLLAAIVGFFAYAFMDTMAGMILVVEAQR